MFRNCFKQIFFVLICFCFAFIEADAQQLDLTEKPANSHIITIIPIPSMPKGVYSDSTNYTANFLTEKLRIIPNWQTLNVLNTLRYLESSNAKKYLDNIIKSYALSHTPDPDDLNKIASTLGADKIILVYGTFDTQEGFLHKSKIAIFNPINDNCLTPVYQYNTIITLYDPDTGIIEWTKGYNKSFKYKTSYMVDQSMSANPTFMNEFNKFSVELSTDTVNELSMKFLNVESTSIQSKIVTDSSTESTKEGVLTTDGHPNNLEKNKNNLSNSKTSNNLNFINKILNPNNTNNKKNSLNNSYKSDLINEVDKEIFSFK